MIGFMFLVVILLIAVLWLITPALLGKREISQDDTDQQNAAIAKERLNDLDVRLEQNEISQSEYEQIKIEIEKSLLQDVRDGEVIKYSSPKIERNAFVIITAIPLMSLALYWLWGSPDSININGQVQQSTANAKQHTGAANQKQPDSVEEMASLLEEKLIKSPNNPKGWYTLGRTYITLKNFDKAVEAFKKVNELVANDVTVLLSLADAMTMAREGNMQGEPFELVKQALNLEKNNPTALWLAGLGYEQSGEFKTAIKHWKQLLPLVNNEPRSVHRIKSLIIAAEQKLGLKPTVSLDSTPMIESTTNENEKSAVSISVNVSLSEKLKSKASANDYVLIYARAAQGPRMPLAIVRKQVKDLPLTVTLDDSMAMQPAMKLSSFSKVDILARVTKTGQAIPQKGDLIGQVGPITISTSKQVDVLINKTQP